MLPLGPQNPAPPTLESSAPSVAPAETLSALLELAKPGVLGLVVVTTFCGAVSAPVPMDFVRLALAMLGTALVVASANALNMVLERDTDALMRRTRSRPLPSGRLGVEAALAFAFVTAGVGLSVLFVWVGELAALLTAIALVSYVAAYTPLKRVTPLALAVGAVPGAMPPLIGWASATASLDSLGWILFGILFVWQLPHFLAIAIFRRDEYARAGHRVLPVVHGVPRTKIEIALYSLLLVAVSLLPVALGLAGVAYAAIALVAGMSFLGLATAGFSARDDSRWARRVFFASMPYLVVVLGSLSVLSAL